MHMTCPLGAEHCSEHGSSVYPHKPNIRDAEGNQFTLILPMFSHSVLAVAALIATAVAHNEPQTPEQVEVQRALQAAAYHVCHSKFRMACYMLIIPGGSALQR
jgi:hypothetical protein